MDAMSQHAHDFAASLTAAIAKRARDHTTETRVEALPDEWQALILEMSEKVAALTLKVAEIQAEASHKFTSIETRQSEMRVELEAFGQVTGNDLLKRSA